jgi:hypothetical protein
MIAAALLASGLVVMARGLVRMASGLVGMASGLVVSASGLVGRASDLVVSASGDHFWPAASCSWQLALRRRRR